MRVTRLRSLLVATALAVGGVAGLGAPAQAAYPVCNTSGADYPAPGVRRIFPAYYNATYRTTTLNCILKATYSNQSAVWFFQQNVNWCNKPSPVLDVDGVYGPRTAKAVTDIQARTGITQDGVYGPVTRQHMRWMKLADDGSQLGCSSY